MKEECYEPIENEIECVLISKNELDSLRQEIKLDNELIYKFRQEIKSLRQALRKCSPIVTEYNSEYEDGGYFDKCIFCPDYLERGHHAEDCEYIKLTKEP